MSAALDLQPLFSFDTLALAQRPFTALSTLYHFESSILPGFRTPQTLNNSDWTNGGYLSQGENQLDPIS